MTPPDIAAKLETIRQKREQLIQSFQFQLGQLAGEERVLREMLAEPKTAEPKTAEPAAETGLSSPAAS